MFKELTEILQAAEFGTEYTLDLKTGTVEESDTLGIDEIVYASYTGKSWQLDYSHSVLPELSTVTDTLYEPASYLNEYALKSHVGDFAGHSKLIATLAIVDTYDCEDCEDSEREDCDHALGWALITALIV